MDKDFKPKEIIRYNSTSVINIASAVPVQPPVIHVNARPVHFENMYNSINLDTPVQSRIDVRPNNDAKPYCHCSLNCRECYENNSLAVASRCIPDTIICVSVPLGICIAAPVLCCIECARLRYESTRVCVDSN